MAKSSESVTNNFEQQLDELEKIVSRMEEGELTLENSIKEFEQGMKLAGQCQKTLQEAEMRVKILMSDIENGDNLQDFNPDADGTAAN